MALDREKERERKRRYRERKRLEARDAVGTAGTVLSIAPKPVEAPPLSTDVQDGVRAELEGLAAAATHPGLAAAAVRMAAILDDPRSVPQHAQAARSLDGLLSRLHEASKGRGAGKLAAMRQARGAS
jgi:hypothetical protein